MNFETETENENKKEIQKNKNKQYYEENKEKLQKKYKTKVLCPLCQKEVAKASLNKHYKSKLCEKGQLILKKRIEIMGI